MLRIQRTVLPTSPRVLCRLLSARPNAAKASSEEIKPYEQIPGRRFWLFSTMELLKPGGLPKNMLPYFGKRHKQFGPLYIESANPALDIVMVVNAEDAETLLRNEAKHPRRLVHRGMAQFFEEKEKMAGVFFAEGEHWYKHRKVVSKRMLRPKEMNEYTPDMNAIVSEFIQHVRQTREPAGSPQEYQVKDLDNSLFRWSFEGVTRFVLDRRMGTLKEPMPDPRGQRFIDTLQQFLGSFVDVQLVPISWNKYYEFKSYKQFMSAITGMYAMTEEFLQEAVQEMKHQEKETEEGRVEFLRYLLQSGSLEEKDLIASIVDIVFAGVDTTSNTIHWCLYNLGRNPEKMRKLEEEVSSVLKPGEEMTNDHLQKIPYLKAVVKESLRLYPVVTQLPRIIPEDLVLSGYHVPAGSQVFIDFFSMARNPDLFPNPEAFIPERWFEETPEQSRFSSLPFGFGVRMCVGRRLAEMEMHLLLARLVQEFRMVMDSQENIPIFFRGVPIPAKNIPIKFYDR